MNGRRDWSVGPGAAASLRRRPALMRSGAIFCALLMLSLVFFKARAIGEMPIGHWDKLVHAGFYGSVAALFTIGLGSHRAVLALCITSLAGLADELHQIGIPTRHADPGDLLADIVAAALAVLLVRLLAANLVDRSPRAVFREPP